MPAPFWALLPVTVPVTSAVPALKSAPPFTDALLLLSVAEIVAVPAAFGVTTPLLLTVAIEELDEDHVTFMFVAFCGKTVAVNVWVVDVELKVIDDELRDTD